MCLDSGEKGRLLDVGCGSGYFLGIMRDAGWDVLGLDNDPEAAKAARELYGVPVIVGTLQEAQLPAQSFDALTLRHVIEHVSDPIGLLTECARVLKPGGKVTIVTPNTRSLAHRRFRDSWRGLEPPRHLYLFSADTLRMAAERARLQVESLSTSARSAGWMWAASHCIQEEGTFSDSDIGLGLRVRGWAFQMRAEIAVHTSREAGEEAVLLGFRHA
jgi:ubiquinone/menaquinone biosynthesis C-methylase UbiE